MVHEVVLNDKKDHLGIVVIDEIHLVGDGHRGFLLELICTKLLLAATDLSANPSPKMSPKSSSVSSMKQATRTQIVGMSATVPNLEQMGQWLNAIVFRIDFEHVGTYKLMFYAVISYFRPEWSRYRLEIYTSMLSTCIEICSCKWPFSK